MDYCTSQFGKALNDITYQDVVNFFSVERTETDVLEFKSAAPNINDNYPGLIKTIAAFLNSKGGLIVLGAPAGHIPDGKKEKVFKGALTSSTTILEKDQVISKCSDKLVPLPRAIRVKVLENGSGGSIAVFEVDESEYAPHQHEGIYYMRIDGQSRPAPHAYVEALIKRIRYPNLEGFIKLTKAEVFPKIFAVSFEVYLCNWSPFQNVEEVKFRVICDHGKYQEGNMPPGRVRLNGHEYTRDPFQGILHYGEPCRDVCTVLVNRNNISKQGNILNLIMTIGARNSPAKVSTYKLSLETINSATPEGMVIERVENELYKDIHEQKGSTRESFLSKLLGREVK